MLVLKRRTNQWVEITHAGTGDKCRVKINKIRSGGNGDLGGADLVFDDDNRHFIFQRDDRVKQPQPAIASE